MTLQEAQKEANRTRQALLALYQQKNDLTRAIFQAEQDNELAQRLLSILVQRERATSAPPVHVTAEEIAACETVLVDAGVEP